QPPGEPAVRADGLDELPRADHERAVGVELLRPRAVEVGGDEDAAEWFALGTADGDLGAAAGGDWEVEFQFGGVGRDVEPGERVEPVRGGVRRLGPDDPVPQVGW